MGTAGNYRGTDKDESNQSLEELDDMLNQNQSSLPMENNPLPHIEQLKKSGLISLVFPKEKQVSQKQIRGEEQASSGRCGSGGDISGQK